MFSKLVGFALLVIGLLLVHYYPPHVLEVEKPKIEIKEVARKQNLCVYFCQDATGSDTVNGVEIVHSKIFTPYFNSIDRDIELNYGLINEHSSVKPICIRLAAFHCQRPAIPNRNLSGIVEHTNESKEYAIALKQYLLDSGDYYVKRAEKIHAFITQVEEHLHTGTTIYASSTDIYSVLVIAKKIFNASPVGTKNVLILNSDGIDSHFKTIPDLHLNADVYVANAGNLTKTSLDSMVTNTYSSSEKAIEISLQ